MMIVRRTRATIVAAFVITRMTIFTSSFIATRKAHHSILAAAFSSSKKTVALAASLLDISISDSYDGGNGKLVEKCIGDNTDERWVKVNIRPDKYTELEKKNHFQSFSFRSSLKGMATRGQKATIKYIIANAGDASYAKAWKGYTTFYSTTPNQPHSWYRKVDTTYDEDNGQLSWSHTHETSEPVYFCYFPPYSYERHLELISKCASSPGCTLESLGQTLDGREIDCLSIGSGPRTCWIIHRQHPGESMAEYYAEGLLERLLGLTTNGSVDGLAQKAKSLYTFHIVPNMCPDGAVRGHLRTNACGANLNREWSSSTEEDYDAPTEGRSPEVKSVLDRMDETGVDVFLDVHGDEELPYNFLAGSEGCPNYGPRLQSLHGAFLAAYSRSNSDMQREISYEPDKPGEGMMNICSNQIAVRFDCLSATLEMPFKDCASNPDPERGWNPARAMRLGSSVLDALCYIHPHLRDDENNGGTWKNLPPEDAYVLPTSKYDC